MLSNIQIAAIRLQGDILVLDYYVETYRRVLSKRGMSIEGVERGMYSDGKIVYLCHYFWEALPDSKEIRRPPFWALTDIAEQVFDHEDK